MGLTGRSAKRRKRYHDQAMNDFIPINDRYGLRLTYNELDAAAWALGGLKADAKNRRELSDWLKVFTNPNGSFVGSLLKWDMPYGKQSELEFKLAAAALKFVAVYNYGANNRKGAAASVFAGYVNYPQGANYEARAAGRQDYVPSRAYFGGAAIYSLDAADRADIAAADKLAERTQNRQGATLAAGINQGADGTNVAGIAPFEVVRVRAENQEMMRKCFDTLPQITARVVEGFKQLNNKNYNAGGHLLPHFKLSIKRNTGAVFSRAVAFEMSEINRNYSKGLRASSLYTPAYASRFYWRLDNDKTPQTPTRTESENDKIQADASKSVDEKAQSYFWEVYSRVVALLEELDGGTAEWNYTDAGDLSGSGTSGGAGWQRVSTWSPGANAGWYLRFNSVDEPRFECVGSGGESDTWAYVADTYASFSAASAAEVLAGIPYSLEQLEAIAGTGADTSDANSAWAAFDKNAFVEWYESNFGCAGFWNKSMDMSAPKKVDAICVGEFAFIVGGGAFGESESSAGYECWSEWSHAVAKSGELAGYDYNAGLV